MFLQHCLFCGEKCDVLKDPKHPGRWRPAYSCREGEIFGNRGLGLREAILEACEVRKDTQSEQIRVRMGGVLTKSIKVAVHQSSGTELNDTAFDSVVKYLAENRGSIHNSIDIHPVYESRRTCAFQETADIKGS